MIVDQEKASLPKMPKRLEHLVVFTLVHIGHMMSKKANRELLRSGFSLQIEQLPILFASYLSTDGLPSQQEIANMLQKDKSGIQRSVRTLERDGYLRIVADEVDRRKNLIELTPAGKLVVEKVIETAEGIDKHVTDQLPREEVVSFMATLHKIFSILER